MFKSNKALFTTVVVGMMTLQVSTSALAQSRSQARSVAETEARMKNQAEAKSEKLSDGLTDQTEKFLANPKKAGRLEKALKKSAGWMENISEASKNSSVQGGLQADIDVLDGMNLNLRTRHRVEPAYVADYFQRFDSFAPAFEINAGEWFLSDNSPFFLNLDGSSEIGVWRYYESKTDALRIKNMPPLVDWVVDYLPVTANRILSKMNAGDMVRFRVPLKIAAGAQYSKNFAGGVMEAKASIAKVYGGNYDVYVFRSDENIVRIRLVGRNDESVQIKAKVGADRQEFNRLEKYVINITDINELVSYELIPDDKNNIFVADYTLNLDYPEVREAYDQLFSKALVFKDMEFNKTILKMINPKASHEDLRDMLITNLTELERLYAADIKIDDHEKRRVDRNFLGSNNTEGKRREFNLGVTGIFRLSTDTNYRENKLTVREYNEANEAIEKNFVFDSWYRNVEKSALLSTYKEDLFQSASIIYEANEQKKPTKFSSIGFYYNYTDKKYKDVEHRDVLKHFRQLLPDAVYQEMMTFLKNNNFDDLDKALRNMKVQSRYFINSNGLANIEKRFKNKGEKDIYEEIYRLVMHVMESKKIAFTSSQSREKTAEKIAKNMVQVVITSNSPEERRKAMNELALIKTFQKIGPAFLVAILPEDTLADSLYFEIKFNRKNQVEPLTFISPSDEKGNPKLPKDREFLEQIIDIQNILNNNVPDLRREGDEDTLTERRTRE